LGNIRRSVANAIDYHVEQRPPGSLPGPVCCMFSAIFMPSGGFTNLRLGGSKDEVLPRGRQNYAANGSRQD